ncbi:MAG: FtsX-like permease family protein, partial [Anaerolineales bacterium]
WRIAYRDLNRNRRRSILTLIAVALGLGLLVVMAGLVAGELDGIMQNSIHLQTGHMQIRATSYEEGKQSLKWEDLLENPQILADQIEKIEGVKAAAPVLWASGVLGTREDNVGVRIYGIDTEAVTSSPFRDGIIAGEYLATDDREGLLIGGVLADSLNLHPGDQVSLLVSTADEHPDEALFTIRGLYSTGVPVYDETTLFLPLDKAQSFTRTENHASIIFILLDEQDYADTLAATLEAPQYQVLTWRDMNRVLLDALQMSNAFMTLLNLVVLAVVGVVIANTLLMAVFERVRDMGVLAALGMKGRQILTMFLLQALTLGVVGILIGILLGSIGIGYLAKFGLVIGDAAGTGSAAMPISSTIYAQFPLRDIIILSATGLVITMLAALYPSWLASRLEPIEALRAQ